MATPTPKAVLERAHVACSIRFLRQGLPRSAIDNDQARPVLFAAIPDICSHLISLVIAFYCLATLDLLGGVSDAISENEQADWRTWLWEQQKTGPWGTGFRGSPYTNQPSPSKYDPPFLIMTYAAILSLAILRDPLDKLDRAGILKYLHLSQREDGSFKLYPSSEEYDLRMTYCAFAICAMLDDWSAIDLDKAAYEGGYGQEPHNEAHGGLSPDLRHRHPRSSFPVIIPRIVPRPSKRRERRQVPTSVCSRPSSERRRCVGYCITRGAGLQDVRIKNQMHVIASGAILGHGDLVNTSANADFLLKCQFKFGGIRKDPESSPDPYHTYLGLASLTILSREEMNLSAFETLDASLNTTFTTRKWLRDHLWSNTSS
ncbi:related to Type I protein geranylgeranyltransferase beta subunit [Serendipita indica DSM 11827]|uniref:Related to Type I protein geranylgeranyltransferase beta subunit n=1 Tax=Serendipita indica (strain DSM 11827) TaxID=1109443 RepID=G4TTX9_SERID|nr:related to Type I protein geranylgeranyltransferase beta subunit [Serendipita indica DSM 11827]